MLFYCVYNNNIVPTTDCDNVDTSFPVARYIVVRVMFGTRRGGDARLWSARLGFIRVYYAIQRTTTCVHSPVMILLLLLCSWSRAPACRTAF